MNSRQKKIRQFDPNGPAPADAGVFGLPFTPEESEIILYPVPWEVTVSYSAGTSKGPAAILEASRQVDLFDPYYSDGWKHGIAMLPVPKDIQEESDKLRKKATRIIQALEKGKLGEKQKAWQKEINKAGSQLTERVKKETLTLIEQGKTVILIGGDHSTPLGYMAALTERHPSFGILQIDAHMDLRNSFEGFRYSHASIMHNALGLSQVSRLVQAGIRDFCEEEVNFVKASGGRVITFYDRHLKEMKYEGHSWKSICEKIVAELPEKVYLSFDIDGLDPKLCPNTGTPVAGGFEAEELMYLLRMVAESGKKIIGADLNEVSPGKNDWDANVASRLLFRICNLIAKSKANSQKPVKRAR